MGNTKTTAQSDASENQKQGIETKQPKKLRFVDRVGMVIAGIGLATSVEAATLDNKTVDLSENGKPAIGEVVDATKNQTGNLKLEMNDQNIEQKMLTDFISIFGQEDGTNLINQYNSLSAENKKIIVEYYNNLGQKPLKCVLLRTGILYNTMIAEDTIQKWNSGNREGFEEWIMMEHSPAILFKFLSRIDKSYNQIDNKGDYYRTLSNTMDQVYIEQLKILHEKLDYITKEYKKLEAKKSELEAKKSELEVKLKKINENIKFLSAIVGTQNQ